ncbi:MAG: Na+/H+ antiporter subunit E [Chloroflexia bacterium]|nr:Na+/H+ antiporter subunit E [Chloroflexia bacterium]
MMYMSVIALAMTLVYALVLASFAWADLATGAMLSIGLMAIYRKTLFATVPQGEYVLHIVVYLPKLIAMLVGDMIKGTVQVATFVIGLRKLDNPGVVEIPLGNHSRAGIGIVGLFITLSPGSFLIDIDWHERVMLVHVIDASNPDATRADAEKYYRLWEYGTHIPPPAQEPSERNGTA